MKTFIVTYLYGDKELCYSRLKGVEASTKAVAEKRARKYAEKDLRMWRQVEFAIEEMTPAKQAEIARTHAELQDKIKQLYHIKQALEDCLSVTKGYRMI